MGIGMHGLRHPDKDERPWKRFLMGLEGKTDPLTSLFISAARELRCSPFVPSRAVM